MQQGGRHLRSLLFALALYAALIRLSSLLLEEEAGEEEHTAMKSMLFLSFYFDDRIIVAKHNKLQQVLGFFRSDEALKYGLHLRLDICSIWWPTEPEAH